MAAKDENQGSGSRKMTPARTQEQAVKCPRCDSQNTKFCYYNNYSLTQPRHFCKTCRRYWTKGGALRNVPIGGGCRKNKKKTSSRLSGDSKDQYPDTGGLKFFHGLSPAMDFQLGGVSFPSLHPSTTGIYNHFSSQIGSNPCLGLDPSVSSGPLMGATNFPLSPMLKQGDHGAGFSGGIQDMGLNTSNLASSIESLSSINQDLHWKLQQQRLAMLESIQNQKERPQPILFQNLEISKPASSFGGMQNNSRREGENGNLATEWLFDDNSSYANIRNSSGNESTSNWNNGLQGWSTTSSNQYTTNFP